ncbi:MAG: ribosome silencing factor [Hyphomicrobiales bacterium]
MQKGHKTLTPHSSYSAKIRQTSERVDLFADTSLLRLVLERLEDAKAEDIVSINIADKTPVADRMVIASGRSGRHVGAIAHHVLEAVKRAGYRGIRAEGLKSCDWVLIDLGDVVTHVFRPEVRSFYELEKLWSADAPSENTVAQTQLKANCT